MACDRPADYKIIPMPDEVIERINQMGKENPEGMIFTDQNGVVMNEEEQDLSADTENVESTRVGNEEMSEAHDDQSSTLPETETNADNDPTHNGGVQFLSNAIEYCCDKISHPVITQYGLKARLKKYGKRCWKATYKELKQMLVQEVFD